MAAKDQTSLAILDALRDLARRLDAAPHGGKGELKDEWCRMHGWSLPKLHRELHAIGWQSGRKRRSDAGSTRQCADALQALGAAVKIGVRKNGKATLAVTTARSLLAQNGHAFAVSNGRLTELLRQRKLDLRTQRQAAPHVRMASAHPNHVHQVDPSLCLLFYTPDGKQHVIRDDEAYKNKPEYLERVGELKCWRYVLTDHYSSTVIVRYYQARGETQANLWDFLLYAWRRLDGRPFHGVPKMLVWDKGSANTSSAIKRALHLLDVETFEHRAGNPRAKGQVENGNNLVECQFESRLRFEPVHSIDELNAAAEAWCNAYNANAIPDYDSRLKRDGMLMPLARYAIWQRIRTEQLRLLPDVDVCRYLLSAEPKPRTVRADMTVSFAHPVAGQSLQYDLRGLAGVHPRMQVLVSPLVMGEAHRVIVTVEDYQGDQVEHVLEPIAYDAFSGQRLDAPVWGDRFDRQPDTVVEAAGKAAERLAFPGKTDAEIERARERNEAPFGGLDAHTHLGEVFIPDYMDRRGTELEVPNRMQVDVKPLTHVQAGRALIAQLGRGLAADENAWLRKTYPDGVSESELPAITARLRDGDLADAPRVGLAVVK